MAVFRHCRGFASATLNLFSPSDIAPNAGLSYFEKGIPLENRSNRVYHISMDHRDIFDVYFDLV